MNTIQRINPSKSTKGVSYATSVTIILNCTCPGYQNSRKMPQECCHTRELLLDTGDELRKLKRKHGAR